MPAFLDTVLSRYHGTRLGRQEIDGEIVEVGHGVHDLKAGDIVTPHFYLSCGHCHWCRVGREPLCENPSLPHRATTEGAGLAAGCFVDGGTLCNGAWLNPELQAMTNKPAAAMEVLIIIILSLFTPVYLSRLLD